jgi:hypothetical protein
MTLETISLTLNIPKSTIRLYLKKTVILRTVQKKRVPWNKEKKSQPVGIKAYGKYPYVSPNKGKPQ